MSWWGFLFEGFSRSKVNVDSPYLLPRRPMGWLLSAQVAVGFGISFAGVETVLCLQHCRFNTQCTRPDCTFYHPTITVPPRHALKWIRPQTR